MGARPLKRAIQRYIEDAVSDLILQGNAPSGSTLIADGKEHQIIVFVRK